MDEQRPPRDPYVIGFIAVLALLLVAGIGLGASIFLGTGGSTAPVPSATTTGGGMAQLRGLLEDAAKSIASELREAVRDITGAGDEQATPRGGNPAQSSGTPPRGPLANPARRFVPLPMEPVGAHVLRIPPLANWTYNVHFGPQWQVGGQLQYATRPARNSPGDAPEADMSWTAGGQRQQWVLGTLARNHPSHANTRFPGFFMHAAYLPERLLPNHELQWDFPWQGGDAAGQAERIRRFRFIVAGWDRVKVPAGEFDAARLQGRLSYLDKGNVKAEVAYTLWYAPAARQAVRLVWMGQAPDEGAQQMIAELAGYRLP